VLSFPGLSALLERVDNAGYDPVNVRCQAGRCEVEAEQDADQRVENAQAGIPAQDKDRDGQHGQGR